MKEYIKKLEINSEIREEKGALVRWVKAHKKELILAGIGVVSITGIILGIKNKDAIKELWAILQKNILKVSADTTVIKVTENSIPIIQSISTTDIISLPVSSEYRTEFDVTGHVRNLYKGWSTSPEKLATAAEYGIELLPGQTWVESYTKGIIAA